jgi:hypothetical protein
MPDLVAQCPFAQLTDAQITKKVLQYLTLNLASFPYIFSKQITKSRYKIAKLYKNSNSL